MEVRGELRAPAALPRGRRSRYQSDRRLGGPLRRESNLGRPFDICLYQSNFTVVIIIISTVLACSKTGIMGPNPTQRMVVCVYSVFVLSCVVSGLATSLSPVQGVLQTARDCLRIKKLKWNEAFHECPMFKSGSNRREIEREREREIIIPVIKILL
jgi:hypothetical protein